LKNTHLDYKVFVLPEFHQTDLDVSGENKQHILIGYTHENNAELDAFLEKIIGSAKLNLKADCLLIKMQENAPNFAFSQISMQHSVKKALFFGINPKSLGLNIDTPTYLLFHLNDCTFLFADPLSKIFTSNELKKALWHCLQQLFLS
jgi:hypothetical protein